METRTAGTANACPGNREEKTIMRDVRLSRKDAARVKHLLTQPKPCLLCGAFPASLQGIFQPTKPELWGGKPGKVRLLGYGLCAQCSTLPDLTLHVEARPMAGLVGRGN
jgi:hypothetical protein